MATITSINAATDSPSSSVGIINTNFSNLNSDKIEATDVRTLTNKTINADNNTITNIGTSNLKSTSKTGILTKIVTGAKGDANELAKWDSNGDLVSTDVTIETSLTSTSDVKLPTSKAVADYITTQYSNTKTLFVPVTAGNTLSSAYDTAVGNFATNTPDNGENAFFNFRVPNNFSSLVSANVVMIPDTTETIQWDLAINYGVVGQAYTSHSATATDSTKSVTQNILTEADIASSLSGIQAGSYVGIKFTSNTTTIRIIGLYINYV